MLGVFYCSEKGQAILWNGSAELFPWEAPAGCRTENAAAGLTVEDAGISFTVRFCRVLEAVSSTGFRIVFREELYDILAVDHLNYKKKALKFLCRKVRR